MGDKRAQVIDDFNIAMSGPRASWSEALLSAKPMEQAFSPGFGARYTNLGREQAATQAAGKYASALSPAAMRTAGGRAQVADVIAKTRAAVASSEAANALGLEQMQLELGQRNWSNKVAYADMQRQNLEQAGRAAGAVASMREGAIQAKEARTQQWISGATAIAGQLFGPAVSGIGSTIAGNMGGGKPKISLPQPTIRLANGGATRNRRMIVGDPQANGRPNPEVILNPTGAPLRIVPIQDMGMRSMPRMPRYAYGTGMTPRLVKRGRRR